MALPDHVQRLVRLRPAGESLHRADFGPSDEKEDSTETRPQKVNRITVPLTNKWEAAEDGPQSGQTKKENLLVIRNTRKLRRFGASLILLAIPAIVAVLCAAPTAVEYVH